MADNSPIVPTQAWKDGLYDAYQPVLDALGVSRDDCGTRNDGCLKVYVESLTIDDIMSAGAFPMSENYTKTNGWLIVTDDGINYAKDHHPSEGKVERGSSSTPSKKTPEELARAAQRKALAERLAGVVNAQREERPDDAPDLDDSEPQEDTDTDE